MFFGVATCVSLAMAQSKRMSAVLNEAPKTPQKWSRLGSKIVQKIKKMLQAEQMRINFKGRGEGSKA